MELAHILGLVARVALFVVNHSAGKDSQAMYLTLRELVPEEQLLVVHAELPGVEWDGTIDHIKATIGNVPLIVCTNENKTFLDMVEARKMWPSPKNRQCTSDLKRGPIERTIRQYLKANPRFGGLVVNCMGMRAEESPGRSKLQPFKYHERNSVAGREWYDWLPIHHLRKDQVFEIIASAGQEPHWAYKAGMTRLSCCFCIMASQEDLRTAARLNVDLYRRYVQTERRIGHTMNMAGKSLEEVTGIYIDSYAELVPEGTTQIVVDPIGDWLNSVVEEAA